MENFMKTLIISLLTLLLAISCTPKHPQNIILLISDGCGFNQVEAARIYAHGQSDRLVFQNFPVRLAMSTYPATGHGYDTLQAWQSFDYLLQKVTDSAASATALASGVKTRNGAIGVDTLGRPVESILERAESLGKATGVVTSVPFSHATPAAFVAHNESRGNYEEIAREMLGRSAADVIMGCGHPLFDESGRLASDTAYKYAGGKSFWDSLAAGKIGDDADGDGLPDPWTLISERADFERLATGKTPARVVGIPKVRGTLQQGRAGDAQAAPFEVPFIETVPTLAGMTRAALNVLDDDPDGFFLMVEGGAVDWAGHENQSGRLIEEELAFTDAVQSVVDWVESESSWSNTLLIVTGDHETGYLTGPADSSGIAPIRLPLVNKGKGLLPGMAWHSHGHTNSLIPFYAKGAGADLFERVVDGNDPVRGKYIDNTDVAQVMLSLFKNETIAEGGK